MADISKIRLSGITYNIVDESAIHSLAGYPTNQEMASAITQATTALAQSIEEQGYQTAQDVQNAISGKANTSDVQPLFGAVEYDSTTKRINFKHNATGTTLAYIDATDFIKDGMVDSVAIVNGNLVITFNTDAGKQPISIPLTDIFNPANYYDKTAIDGKMQDIDERLDEDEEVTAAALVALQDAKQDNLESGVNIKTVNNQSLLGSGNITIQGGGAEISVSGETLVIS